MPHPGLNLPEPLALLDRYFSAYLDCDIGSLLPGETMVVPSARRERRELCCADVFVVWALVSRRRCAVSVQPGLVDAVAAELQPAGRDPFAGRRAGERLAAVVGGRLAMKVTVGSGPVSFCTIKALRRTDEARSRPVRTADIPMLMAAGLYEDVLAQSVRLGLCFAAFEDDRPVALAGTTPVPHLADRIAEVNLAGVLPGARRRGLGAEVLRAVTRAALGQGLIPVYATSDHNLASQRTATAVGYMSYGWQLRVRPDSGA